MIAGSKTQVLDEVGEGAKGNTEAKWLRVFLWIPLSSLNRNL